MTTRLSMMSEGSDSAVTAIMKASTVPSPTPLPHQRLGNRQRAEDVGIHRDADQRRDRHRPPLVLPQQGGDRISAGTQLWIAAPMPTPIKT